MCVSPQRQAIFRQLSVRKCSEDYSFLTFWLSNVLFATAACNFSTSEQTKVVQTCGVLYILTFKCAFRHSGDFQMCFSPQRRAIFRHRNFKKWSKHAVFCTFWLANVLFATAACNFWFRLWAPTSAPAALTGLLFDWPDTRIIEKTQHFATSLTFGADVSSFFWLSRYCIFCRLTWGLYCWAMHLLFNCPYCRKFLFKLPSMIQSMISSISHPIQPSWKIAFAAAKASSTQPDSVSSDSSDSFLSTQQPSRRRWRTTRTRSPPSRDQCLGIFPSIYQIGRPEVVGRQIECQPEELDVASCYRVLQIAWMFKKSRMRCSICFLLLLLSFFKCFSSKLESFLRQGIEQ